VRGATPRCCIAERKGTSGESICRAFAQAIRHLYLVASTGWTQRVFGAKPPCVFFPPDVVSRRGEKNACAATDLAPWVEFRRKRVCSESEVLSSLLAAGEEAARCGNDGLMDRRRKLLATPSWGGRGPCISPIPQAVCFNFCPTRIMIRTYLSKSPTL
jgi:hypothetical protein